MTAVTCALEELTLLEGALTEELVDGLDDGALTRLLLSRFRHFVIGGDSMGEALLRAAGFSAAEAGALAIGLREEPELFH